MKRHRKSMALSIFVLGLGFFFWFIPPVYKLRNQTLDIPVPVSKNKTEIKTFGPGTKTWTRFNQIPKHLVFAVVASEDSRFFDHRGIDFREISHSIRTNLKSKRYARGASTLTQQLVKMAFLSRKKSLIRKVREALGSFLVEVLFTKNEIIEWYINLAEFGPGIWGIRQAAQVYFQKHPSDLSLVDAIHLAQILPNPRDWSAGLRAKELTPFGRKRFAYILKTMRQMGFLNEAQVNEASLFADFGRPLDPVDSDAEHFEDFYEDSDIELDASEEQP